MGGPGDLSWAAGAVGGGAGRRRSCIAAALAGVCLAAVAAGVVGAPGGAAAAVGVAGRAATGLAPRPLRVGWRRMAGAPLSLPAVARQAAGDQAAGGADPPPPDENANVAPPAELVNTATLVPIPADVRMGDTLLRVNLFVAGTNWTDDASERVVTCSSAPAATGGPPSTWSLVNATRFTPDLLQANYAVVVATDVTGDWSRRWVAYARTGELGACVGWPDGAASASVAPFDARARVVTPARTFGVWVPALIIGVAAAAAVLALAGYALTHIRSHYTKGDLADPDAPEYATVEEARGGVGGADSDTDSGYDSEEEILPAQRGGSAAGGAALAAAAGGSASAAAAPPPVAGAGAEAGGVGVV